MTTAFRLAWLAALPLSILADEAWARAGGSGGDGFGGFLGGGAMLALLLYSSILSYVVFRKNREARAALKKAGKDPFWDADSIKDRIEHVFFKVQDAWTRRDPDFAKDCVSTKILEKHRMRIERMVAEGTRNVLESIHLSRATIVEIADYRDNARDQLYAVITGSMVDYTIRESTGEVIKGKKAKAEKFSELWKFVRKPHGWVLDEINSTLEIGELLRMASKVE